MRAIAIDAFGGPERLHEVELPDPEPGPGEVRIRIACASVNPVDWKIREGWLKDLFPHRFPLVPGWDAAGTVDRVGEGVERPAPGARVFAYCRKPEVQWGTYAEHVVVPAGYVAEIPQGLGFPEAAAIPLTALTAWQALFDFADLGPGQRVLVHAGAGGVGGMAIQLARHAGATVYTTARRENHDYVLGLGAERAIDYTETDFREAVRELAPEGVDVVLDAVGGETLARSYELVRRGGTLVSIVEEPDAGRTDALGIRAGFVFVRPDGAQLARIARLLEEGALRPPQIEVLPFARAAEAQERNRARHVRGKLVLCWEAG